MTRADSSGERPVLPATRPTSSGSTTHRFCRLSGPDARFLPAIGQESRLELTDVTSRYARVVREHWTLDPDLVYLNHGSFGAVPAVTQQAQRRLQAEAEANPMRWFR